MSDGSREKAMAAVKAIFDKYHQLRKAQSFNGYDVHVMKSAKLLNATARTARSIATVEYSLLMDESFANMNGVMHGGAACVIFDMLTTTALGPIATEGFWDFLGGVSRTINISYLRAVPIGTTVKIKSEVTQAGRTMAMIKGTMMSLDEEIIYCTCEHHKVGVPTRKEHSTASASASESEGEKAKL